MHEFICILIQFKYKKDGGLADTFLFAYLKVHDTKYRILSERFKFSTHKLCKSKRKINIDSNAEQRKTLA